MRKVPKSSGPGSREQPRSDFNWPPTEEELAPSGIDNTQTAQERLRAYFNWPSDDEAPPAPAPTGAAGEPQSASGLNWPPAEETTPPTGSVQDAPPVTGAAFNWPPPDEPAEPKRIEPASQEAEPSATFEPSPTTTDEALEAADPMPLQIAVLEHVPVLDDSREDAVAAAADEPEVDEIITDHWDVEIARLQSLIEGLTEKLEWRVTATPGTEQRMKH